MIAGLLLAAGGARRFGAQKLVQPHQGKPLVRHAAEALAASTDALFVIVGHEAEKVRSALDGVRCECIVNADWASGLAGSVRAGIAALPDHADGVVIALGDQPGIDARVVRALIERRRDGAPPIVASRYRGVRGHPVLFDRSMFPELAALEGDVGAKPVIERAGSRVAHVDVDSTPPPDVDTAADLASLGE